jgi:surface protein
MITPYSNIISVTTLEFPFEFTINTANTSAGSTAANQFKLPLVSSLPLNAVVDWGDGSSDTITVFNQAETTHTYASSGTYTVSITGDLSGWRFDQGGDCRKMLEIVHWGVLNITTNRIFGGCINMICTASDAPLITTTNLQLLFADCLLFNGNISNWDVSNVAILDRMFIAATAFNQDIGSWDVSSVTNMQGMFQSATSFNQDIGSWDVSNVTNFTNFMANKTAANYSAANLDSIYNNWSQLSVQPNLTISFGTIKYNASAQAAKDILTSAPNNWTITDGGQV